MLYERLGSYEESKMPKNHKLNICNTDINEDQGIKNNNSLIHINRVIHGSKIQQILSDMKQNLNLSSVVPGRARTEGLNPDAVIGRMAKIRFE
jgi:hypothetical protein